MIEYNFKCNCGNSGKILVPENKNVETGINGLCLTMCFKCNKEKMLSKGYKEAIKS